MPRAWQASATSTAYSRNTTGSLYVKATLRHPSARAAYAMVSGSAWSASVPTSRDLLMSGPRSSPPRQRAGLRDADPFDLNGQLLCRDQVRRRIERRAGPVVARDRLLHGKALLGSSGGRLPLPQEVAPADEHQVDEARRGADLAASIAFAGKGASLALPDPGSLTGADRRAAASQRRRGPPLGCRFSARSRGTRAHRPASGSTRGRASDLAAVPRTGMDPRSATEAVVSATKVSLVPRPASLTT